MREEPRHFCRIYPSDISTSISVAIFRPDSRLEDATINVTGRGFGCHIDLQPSYVEELIEALQEVREFQKENCKTQEKETNNE